MFLHVLSIVLPVFMIIWLGFFLRLCGLAPQGFIKNANRLIYYAALPALLFHKIATADFSQSFNLPSLTGYLTAFLLLTLFSYRLSSIRGYEPIMQGTFTQTAVRGNLAYVALAVCASAYGEEGVAKAGILLGCLVPLINITVITVLLLPHRHEKKKEMNAVTFCREILYNPLCIGSVVGISWCYWQIPFPDFVAESFSLFGSLALPLALLCIGASFLPKKKERNEEKHITPSKKCEPMLLSIVIKLVVQPCVTACVVYLFGGRGIDLSISVLFAGAPTATVSYILADQLNGDALFTARAILYSTLLTLFTYTAALFFLHNRML